MFTKPRPFPRLLGACGQLILLDHHGVPLETYISATWEKRSDLALQLLNIVDLFAVSPTTNKSRIHVNYLDKNCLRNLNHLINFLSLSYC